MLSAVAGVAAPGAAVRFDADARAFHAALGTDMASAMAVSGKLAQSARGLSDALERASFGPDAAFNVVAFIAKDSVASRFTDYEGGIQAVMAMDTLLNALVKQRRMTIGAAAGIRATINRAYAAVAGCQWFPARRLPRRAQAGGERDREPALMRLWPEVERGFMLAASLALASCGGGAPQGGGNYTTIGGGSGPPASGPGGGAGGGALCRAGAGSAQCRRCAGGACPCGRSGKRGRQARDHRGLSTGSAMCWRCSA